ncbi:MAG: outer membrane beta-barrel family protein [Bacteroides sp.]|nr:outer membrane beta-barrel family protein [Alistipes timonensis]MCM1311082.1 outer membrane beta-barrel family protein [Bacteroides sp.]
MAILKKLLLGAALLPASLFAREVNDSIADSWERELELNEVVVVARRPVMKQDPDKIVYLIQNDPYAKGLNGIEALDRIPRVSVTNEQVMVAGKSSVRYIVDGHLLEMPEDAIASRLRNLTAAGIEKIEVHTTPPAKYAAGTNVAFISITTRNEALGTRGNVWGNGTVREDFSYLLGGNVSHTTRKVEIAADAGWSDTKGINGLDRTYTFADHRKTSTRSTNFANCMLGVNGLFKYKFSSRLSAGAIINFSSARFKSRLSDVTVDNGIQSESFNYSPARPNNAVTLTAFSDWMIDDRGKTLSFTYNFFNKYTRSFSDVTTNTSETQFNLTNEGINKYHIHSAKLDAVLPLNGFKMEAGAAFTAVGNNTRIDVNNLIDGQWVNDAQQSNAFNYDENTAAVYLSAEKSFSNAFFGKIGLRYEHTDVKGHQTIGNERHNNSYGSLFPSITFSWNKPSVGRFAASYSMGISRPNFADLNPFKYYTTTTDYVSGNPDLNPSVSHNAEINYSGKGIYAVLYNSYNHNAIGYITRFGSDGSQYTVPENFINNNKTGLYASYNRSLFDWWNVKVGGEVFYTYAKSKVTDFKAMNDKGWSGKVELNTSWMLNRKKTLVLNLRFTHMFPYHDRMIHYESMSLIGADIRYMLLNNRLVLTASVNDPFGWNITKSTALYNGFSVYTKNNIHSHAVSFRISYSFGGNKVNNVYRDSKERESARSY